MSNADKQGAALAAHAEALFAQRRLRDAALADTRDLFGEPAWDMLLHIYIQRANGLATPVVGLSDAGFVPATTGLRWVGKLVDRGLLERISDVEDRRRAHLHLTPDGLNLIERMLQATLETGR